jgi:hypothetical protein
MQNEIIVWDRLKVFAFLWGLAIIIHTTAFAYNVLSTPVTWVMIALATILVLNPKSLPVLLALCFVQIIEFSVGMPRVSNHWLITTLMSLNIIICLLYALSRKRGINREALFDTIAVAGRLLVIIVFWVATFHKLNSDFLNPVVSCAVSLYQSIADLYYLPQNELISWLTIYGTYLIEFFLPVLLIIPRTRNWGIVLGMLFHLVLGMRQIYDFAAMLYALYFLFVSKDFMASFMKAHAHILSRLKPYAWLGKLLLFLLLLIPARWIFTSQLTAEYFAPLWILAASVAIYLAVMSFRQERPQQEAVFAHLPSARLSFFMILLIGLVNGFSPYIGLKTNLSFDMYSNLRLENSYSNHLLIPASWQLFPFTRDFAEVLESNDPFLERYVAESWLISRHELSRFIQTRPNYTSRIRYQGQEYLLPQDSAAFEPVNPVLLWFLSFEPIEQTEFVTCSW